MEGNGKFLISVVVVRQGGGEPEGDAVTDVVVRGVLPVAIVSFGAVIDVLHFFLGSGGVGLGGNCYISHHFQNVGRVGVDGTVVLVLHQVVAGLQIADGVGTCTSAGTCCSF